MMKIIISPKILCICLILLSVGGCTKQDEFLDAKSNETLTIPSSLSDLKSLLLNEGIFNTSSPSLGALSSDEYYVTTDLWTSSGSATERNAYIFAKDIFQGAINSDWNQAYQQIYYANTVLDYLPKIKTVSGQQDLYNQIKGTALFYRSIAFYNLVQTFALPYNANTASADPGIPLRLSSDLNIQSVRSTVQQCYHQIIEDLSVALPLLPTTVSYLTQPSQNAANALLARIYLAIGQYQQALDYANTSLSLNSVLVDYNTFGSSAYFLTNTTGYLAEDIYHCTAINYGINGFGKNVDSALYSLYENNDLRKTAFFTIYNNRNTFKGSYELSKFGIRFSGLANDEIYLIRAECYARSGNTDSALHDLNTLLLKRYKNGTFVPRVANNSDAALQLILLERRKELLFRGLRWTDLRRLNQDSRFATTIQRTVNNVVYSLPPNSPLYAMPIPDQEIQLNGLSQNVR
jgi:tetratricopeptide (TPR) repeat protein